MATLTPKIYIVIEEQILSTAQRLSVKRPLSPNCLRARSLRRGKGQIARGSNQEGFKVQTRMALTGVVGQTTSQAPQPMHLSLTTG